MISAAAVWSLVASSGGLLSITFSRRESGSSVSMFAGFFCGLLSSSSMLPKCFKWSVADILEIARHSRTLLVLGRGMSDFWNLNNNILIYWVHN